MKTKALILTCGKFQSPFAKTAHGLIRASDHYQIIGVLNRQHSQKDAGEVLDGTHRNISFFRTIEEALQNHPDLKYAIIGVAMSGGIIPNDMEKELLTSLENGISIINGLHTFLSDIPKYAELAAAKGLELIDLRKQKPISELAFWTGAIFKVSCPIIAVLGTDCALGKRTTTRLLMDVLKADGVNAAMIYTGQTGALQTGGHGFIFDSTLNDFVSGELESAIVDCFQKRNPDVILLEGQASLFNPSGPCGSEYLISANAKKVILQHAPGRLYFDGWEHLELKIPPIEKTIRLIEMYDSEVIGIALNDSVDKHSPALSTAEMDRFKAAYETQFKVPVLNPLKGDLVPLIRAIKSCLNG